MNQNDVRVLILTSIRLLAGTMAFEAKTVIFCKAKPELINHVFMF